MGIYNDANDIDFSVESDAGEVVEQNAVRIF